MHEPTDVEGLVELTREWSDLDRLAGGMSPQWRGQRLNGFVAEMLNCWGIDARPNQRSMGEIDVAFRISDQRFILEAKWESRPTDTGALAKLKTRVQQRLAGVLGAFVSINGYSEEALQELNQGQRSAVLLFDRQHVQAMLTGLVSPLELFDAALDHAFYTGRPYAPLEELFAAPAVPDLRFDAPLDLRGAVGGDATAEVVLAEIPVWHLGFTEDRPGVLLVSSKSGVLEVDLAAERIARLVDLTGCRRRPLRINERIFFIRGAGVGVLEGGRVSAVAGPFRGSVTLLLGPGDAPWIFSNGDMRGANAELAQAVQLGREERFEVPYAGANSRNALWLGEERFAITGNMGVLLIDLASGDYTLSGAVGAAPNEDGIIRLSERALLVASDGARLWEFGLVDGSFAQRAYIPLPDSGHELEEAKTGKAYISSPMPGRADAAAIFRCTLPEA